MERLRFVTASQHAVLDYALDVGLIAAPLLFGFTGLAFWLSVSAGVLNIGYSLLTSYSGGLVKLVPFSVHLGFDAALGALFIIVALLAGFAGWELAWYLAVGIGIALAVLITRVEQ
jgi:hypothetical protein